MEQLELSYTIYGNVKCTSKEKKIVLEHKTTLGKRGAASYKVKHLLDTRSYVYPGKHKFTKKNFIFMEALFMIAQKWDQHKCPSAD